MICARHKIRRKRKGRIRRPSTSRKLFTFKFHWRRCPRTSQCSSSSSTTNRRRPRSASDATLSWSLMKFKHVQLLWNCKLVDSQAPVWLIWLSPKLLGIGFRCPFSRLPLLGTRNQQISNAKVPPTCSHPRSTTCTSLAHAKSHENQGLISLAGTCPSYAELQ